MYNEAEALFRSEVREKKEIARSARKRVVNKKSGCRLPVRTAEEIRSMSSPCQTYNLDIAMTWSDFQNLPMGAQEAYLRLLAKKYSIGEDKLGELFIGEDPRELHNFLQMHALTGLMKHAKKENFDETKWETFIKSERQPPLQGSPAEQLRAIRLSLGLTQMELSLHLHCSNATICRAEKAHSSDQMVLQMIRRIKELQDAGQIREKGSTDNPTEVIVSPSLSGKKARTAGKALSEGQTLSVCGAPDMVADAIAKLLNGRSGEVQVTISFAAKENN